MWNCETSFRNENEISASSVQSFYGNIFTEIYKELLFNEALDAVVRGCVTEYSYDNKEKKFVGIVTSFEDSRSYEVKISVTDDFTIQSASCDCPERFCHHVGALALHTGFKTPIFSCVEQETNETTTTNLDKPQNKTEIEFIGLEAQETKNTNDGVDVHVVDTKKKIDFKVTHKDVAVIGNVNCDDSESYVDPISIKNEISDQNQINGSVQKIKKRRRISKIGFRMSLAQKRGAMKNLGIKKKSSSS